MIDSGRPWRILVVDDVEANAETAAELLRTYKLPPNDVEPIVDVQTEFADALELIVGGHYDLVVLDVWKGGDGDSSEEGREVFEAVRQRLFNPVVFHTAIPDSVADLEDRPFVWVVDKHATGAEEPLREAARQIFASGLPALNRGLLDHVSQVVRDSVVGFVQPHWEVLASPERRTDVAHLLVRRLALSLADDGDDLSRRIGGTGSAPSPAHVHPLRCYIVPPVGSLTTGDLLRDDAPSGEAKWYVVLTPACDFVPRKGGKVHADFVVMARCLPLSSTAQYQKWAERLTAADVGGEKAAAADLMSLMGNNGGQKDRHVYLPGAFEVPDLVVDFQRIRSVKRKTAEGLERVATLDSPYAEALTATFNRFVGRVGTPDLDVQLRLGQIRESVLRDMSTPADEEAASGDPAA